MATSLDLICAVLRKEPASFAEGADPAAVERFLDEARYHGVLPLLDEEFASRDDCAAWPKAILMACHKAMLARAVQEPAQRAQTAKVIDALAGAGVNALVLKGTALAYTHYARPALRPRADVDLLIPPASRDAAARVLAALGYTKAMGVEGEFVSYQATWSLEAGAGMASHLDVHWRINNSQMLARVLTYDELAARTRPLAALGAQARTLADVDALLFACIHRAGHANAPYFVPSAPHVEGDRLIWLYDIHLLAIGMSAAELDEFASLAAAKGIRTICRHAVDAAIRCFATPVPSHVLESLTRPGPAEATARYLSGGRARQMVGDFLALERWGDRLAWAREMAFPVEAYMRAKYPDSPGTWLPILHVRRLSAGIAGLVLPSRRH